MTDKQFLENLGKIVREVNIIAKELEKEYIKLCAETLLKDATETKKRLEV